MPRAPRRPPEAAGRLPPRPGGRARTARRGGLEAADGEPVILRCGLDRPAEFVVGSPIQVVDAVQWFEVADRGRSTWFAVDRPVYVALTLPQGSGPTPIQEISDAIAKSLPATEIDPARRVNARQTRLTRRTCGHYEKVRVADTLGISSARSRAISAASSASTTCVAAPTRSSTPTTTASSRRADALQSLNISRAIAASSMKASPCA